VIYENKTLKFFFANGYFFTGDGRSLFCFLNLYLIHYSYVTHTPLSPFQLRDIELNPVVNRDLSRRVRPISGIAQHSTCARSDLKNIVRLIMHLDQKWKLWTSTEVWMDFCI